MKSFEEEIQIPLEARHLNSLKNSFKETCKYVFPYISDDRILCSQCLNVLNIRFNEFRCIRCFDQNFEKLSTSEPNSHEGVRTKVRWDIHLNKYCDA